MSNQKPQNQGKTKEESGVEKRRRFMKGAGVVAPVVLTLSSPSVFGIQCGSEIASGNESQVGEGSCVQGHSIEYWLNHTTNTWPSGYVPVTIGDINATLFNDTSKAFGTAASATGISSSGQSLLALLSDSTYAPWVAALLNSVAVLNYAFPKDQLIDLWINNPSGFPIDEAGKKAVLISTFLPSGT